ncbi:MAG: hypothetical protein D6698_15800 [Gammaproteobacteria bacterium]|nr:MAG: hypothetical protein D6698_15800 [Gammaproteobacteria bacterium]
MTYSAAEAYSLAQASIAKNTANELQLEVTLAEKEIRAAAFQGRTFAYYHSVQMGDPLGDPSVDDALTDLQRQFRDTMTAAGYRVGRHEITGYWKLEFGAPAILQTIVLYQVRTSLTPGAIIPQTIDAITKALNELTPAVSAEVRFVPDVDETAYGSQPSIGYEFIVVAVQQDSSKDHSSVVQTALLNSGLGYTTTNTLVNKI